MGPAICERLLADGFDVSATYGSEDQDFVTNMPVIDNLKLHCVDLFSRSSVTAFADKMKGRKINAIVNTATYFDFERFFDYNYEIWDKTIAANVTAPFILVHELKSALATGASIINLSTTDAFVGAFASTAFAASKLALLSITKSFANNLGPLGIRCNAIAAGWIGDVAQGATETQKGSVEITPLKRLGRPSEIANTVSFLISEQASFINGATIVVDGGYTGVDLIGKREAMSEGLGHHL